MMKSRKAPSRRLFSKTRVNQVLEMIRKMVTGGTALEKISSRSDSSPFRVLISTVLSARTRDRVTEAASNRLFSRYRSARALSSARSTTVSKIIKPVSFYNVKAERIIRISKELERKFSGKVPRKMDQLLDLPGVGRKTANCVLVYGFNEPSIPVDVHVHRISNRIGLVETQQPEETEIELSKLYRKDKWLDVNELFVRFGQTICKPVGPKCEVCLIRESCRYYASTARS